jgi:lysozyme
MIRAMISYSQDVISRALAQAVGISKLCEGLRLAAYPDPASGGEPWTIGYGSTRIYGRAVQPGDVLANEGQAWAMLQADLMGSLQIVADNVGIALNGDQLGALTSFVNNVGPGEVGVKDGFVHLKSGGQSSMLRYLNLGLFPTAAAQFPLWVNGGGHPMGGLVKRRAVEMDVFLGKLDMTGGAPAAVA